MSAMRPIPTVDVNGDVIDIENGGHSSAKLTIALREASKRLTCAMNSA